MTQAALYIALLAGALAEIWNPPPHRRWPVLTLAVLSGILAFAWTLGIAPALTDTLARDPRMLASGEVWRALTSLFLPSEKAAYNVFWLIVLGTAAERRFSRIGWAAIYFGGGMVSEFLALAWQPHGAGNSIACLALAGALCSDWREGAWRRWRAGIGLTGTAAACVLLWHDDIHGIGFALGLLIGFTLVALESRRRGEPAWPDNVIPFRRDETLH